MGLFSNKKKLCPLCGGPTPRLLATKVEDMPLCKDCADKIDLPSGAKGGEKMDLDRHDEHKQHTFDSFCKKVIRCEAYNAYRAIGRRQDLEIPFSQLPEEAMEALAAWDVYPWEYTSFPVDGDVILIKDDRLADALTALPQRFRDILLMYWFLELADREIGERLSLSRRTVNNRRQQAYELLKKLMGGEADD